LQYLKEFIETPNDPEINFRLGYEYEKLGQTASAVSHYLRTAERGDNVDMSYEAVVRMALCFLSHYDQLSTVVTILQRAIALNPRRIEAYYLLARYYERQGLWQESYFISSFIMDPAYLPPKTITYLDCPGPWALEFQKGVAAWWVGNCEESREIMYELQKENLDPIHRASVEKNVRTVGLPKRIAEYTYKDAVNLRYKFPGYEKVEHNFSQVMQDLFVISAHKGKMNGTYLEVGCNHPYKHNNTALLQNVFEWTGLGIDIDPNEVMHYCRERGDRALCLDATKCDYKLLCAMITSGNIIDYLQIDVDPAEISWAALQKIPFDRYKFGVITFEHDHYDNASNHIREKSRTFLKEKGYELVVSDMGCFPNLSFEDWYVHPDLIDRSTIKLLKDTTQPTKQARKYMLV